MQITPTLYRILKKVVIGMTETEKKYDAIRRAYPERASGTSAVCKTIDAGSTQTTYNQNEVRTSYPYRVARPFLFQPSVHWLRRQNCVPKYQFDTLEFVPERQTTYRHSLQVFRTRQGCFFIISESSADSQICVFQKNRKFFWRGVNFCPFSLPTK